MLDIVYLSLFIRVRAYMRVRLSKIKTPFCKGVFILFGLFVSLRGYLDYARYDTSRLVVVGGQASLVGGGTLPYR